MPVLGVQRLARETPTTDLELIVSAVAVRMGDRADVDCSGTEAQKILRRVAQWRVETIASILARAEAAEKAREAALGNLESVRMERDAVERQRVTGNAYLIARAELAEADARALREGLETIRGRIPQDDPGETALGARMRMVVIDSAIAALLSPKPAQAAPAAEVIEPVPVGVAWTPEPLSAAEACATCGGRGFHLNFGAQVPCPDCRGGR